ALREPEEIRHLRAYSNYLAPKRGLLSADTWVLIGTYLRNLFLNWLVFIPLLLAACGIPRLYIALLKRQPLPYMTLGGSSPHRLTFCLWTGLLLAVWAIAYCSVARPGAGTDENRTPHRSRVREIF